MHALWKNKAYTQYEKNYPLAFPWNRSGKEDVPRYVPGPMDIGMTPIVQIPAENS